MNNIIWAEKLDNYKLLVFLTKLYFKKMKKGEMTGDIAINIQKLLEKFD